MRRVLVCAIAVGLLATACSGGDGSSDTTEVDVDETDAPTTVVETSAPTTTSPATTAAPTTTEAVAQVTPGELLAVLTDLENAIEIGDTDAAAHLGGPAGEAASWYRKLAALFPDVWTVAPTSLQVDGDLTVVDDDGTTITTDGEYTVTFADGYELTQANPTFTRVDGEIVLVDAEPVGNSDGPAGSTFDLGLRAGEPTTSDGGREIVFRTASLGADGESGFADFAFTSDDASDQYVGVSAHWIDAVGIERITRLHTAVDDRTGLMVLAAAFGDLPLHEGIADDVGAITLHFSDGDSAVVDLPDVPEDVAGRELLEPLPAPDPSVDPQAVAPELVDIVTAYVDASSLCSALPNECVAEGPFGPVVAEDLQRMADAFLADGIRIQYPNNAVFHRVDEVRVHPSGLAAVVETCNRDGAIQVDIGDPADPSDDEVVNDLVLAAQTLFVLDRIDGAWALTSWGQTQQHVDDTSACDPADTDTVIDVVDPPAEEPTEPAAGVNAAGEIEFRQTIVAYIESVVASFGEQALDPQVLATAITDTYPSLAVTGYQIDATPTSISLFVGPVDDKRPAGPDNLWVITAAVVDTSGTCMAFATYGFPVPTESVSYDDPLACNAFSVYEATVNVE